ncbi:MAG: aspartate/glutamate racemase family protein [Planctomycetaceae bacterium]
MYSSGSCRLVALQIVFVICGGFEKSSVLADELPAIQVSSDGTHFVVKETGVPFRPMGFNYDHDPDGRLLEDYWHTEWDRVENDFRDMQALGANVVRIHLQFGKFMKSATEANAEELKQLQRLLRLAEETKLYLDLTGLGCYHKKDVPVWYDALDEQSRWNAQQVFWESVASVCSESSAIFCYDLMNEPVIGGDKAGPDWLGPAFAGKHFVQFVAKSTNGRTRPEAARQWIDQMVNAVRQHDKKHLITVGFVDWSLDRPGLTSGFDPLKVAEKLDFLAVHIYPAAGKVDEALETLKGFQIGKPVIVEETFPLKCSHDEMKAFIDRSGDQADGWISFFWGKMPDEYRSTASIGDAIISQWLTQFSAMMKAEKPQVSTTSEDDLDDGTKAVVTGFIQHTQKNSDGRAAFSVDLKAWSDDSSDLPIGVFDSGIGGLTVQEAIYALDAFDNDNYSPTPDGKKDFANERFIYFGDQANMPYGNYPAVHREAYLKELILKDAAFLLGRRYWNSADDREPQFDKPPVKAIVIACNTATAWGLNEIREVVDTWKVPVFVIGVVEAGARGLTESIETATEKRTVAVLATVGTCSSNAYPKAIGRSAGLAGKRVPDVVQQGSVGLAAAIEGDPAFVISSDAARLNATVYNGPSLDHKTATINPELLDVYGFNPAGLQGDLSSLKSLRLNSVENYIRYDVATLVNAHQRSGQTTAIDTVVLGCTHFPLVRQEILDSFARLRAYEKNGERPFANLIAEKIAVVDPAELTAKELFRELARRKMFRRDHESSKEASEAGLRDQFFISIANAGSPGIVLSPDGSLDRDYKYGRSAGHLEFEDTICVPMTQDRLPETSLNLIRSKLPHVWQRLNAPSP